ncbi:MAG: phosphotransferase enzyme family protein [Micromonosporaceae bacterium]
MHEATATLAEACHAVGMDSSEAELIRAGENMLYRLPGGVVARVSRPGQFDAAVREVKVSRWLRSHGVPVVEALGDVDQPVAVDGRAVTFWRELLVRRDGSLVELALLLRTLHSLPAPPFDLPPLSPFVRLRERITECASLQLEDRTWLLDRLNTLQQRYAELPPGLPWCAVHGDAWDGNVAVTDDGPVLLDLERFAYGPPEWDLASVAVDHVTFGLVAIEDWEAFRSRYGRDVITWPGFELLRDIRELRKVTFAWQIASERHDIVEQARYRLDCLRGERGPRPWGWTAVA